jgi:hypothetical protein
MRSELPYSGWHPTGSGRERARVAEISDAVLIGVDLSGVREAELRIVAGTVVEGVGDAVAVAVVGRRARGPGIEVARGRDVVGTEARAATVEVGAVSTSSRP